MKIKVPFSALAFATAMISFLSSPAQSQSQKCASIKSPSARLACYDKSSTPQKIDNPGFGTVEGTITWQYNKFVGTKGDVGAKVIIFRQPFDDAISQMTEAELKGFQLGYVTEKAGKIYNISVDGFGQFSQDGIPAGTYKVYVFSGKTTPAPDDVYTNSCLNDVKKIKDMDIRFFNKVYCSTIKVEVGQKTRVVHDFGNTYF